MKLLKELKIKIIFKEKEKFVEIQNRNGKIQDKSCNGETKMNEVLEMRLTLITSCLQHTYNKLTTQFIKVSLKPCAISIYKMPSKDYHCSP